MEYDYDEVKGLFYMFKESGDVYKFVVVNVILGKVKDFFLLLEMELI